MDKFEIEWKKYCASKGGGAVTMNVKDVAKHFAQWQREEIYKKLFRISMSSNPMDYVKGVGELMDELKKE